jgi:hypothetical protein
MTDAAAWISAVGMLGWLVLGIVLLVRKEKARGKDRAVRRLKGRIKKLRKRIRIMGDRDSIL